MSKILIIEDDLSIQSGLKAFFESEGFEVGVANDGQEGIEMTKAFTPDVITLDLMLPKKSGYDVCKELRAGGNNVPIIMLTSKTEEIDKILGLEIGADDYLTKPFGIRELHARIRALLRRLEMASVSVTGEVYEFDDIKIVWKNQEVTKSGDKLTMTAKQFQVFKFFVEHEGEIVSRNMLLDEVWGYDSYPTTRTVDNFILSLRKLIEDDPSNPKHIITIHTIGYRFLR